MIASLATSVTLGLSYLYQNNIGQLKDHTLNTLQKQRQDAQTRQAQRDTTYAKKLPKWLCVKRKMG